MAESGAPEKVGWIDNGVLQEGWLRAVHGWHRRRGRYEDVFVRHNGEIFSFTVVYEYRRPDLIECGPDATGFLAEIVVRPDAHPDAFGLEDGAHGLAMAMIRGADRYDLLEIAPAVRVLLSQTKSGADIRN
ncbi:MAG: hypothetical protein WA459_06135 [Stellaceae bacterium]